MTGRKYKLVRGIADQVIDLQAEADTLDRDGRRHAAGFKRWLAARRAVAAMNIARAPYGKAWDDYGTDALLPYDFTRPAAAATGTAVAS